ncbi:MAG: PIN domain-containing protein [Gemmataceae bacterium]|nr:PIN domain-containing protein [Gemmataceae bacterium]
MSGATVAPGLLDTSVVVDYRDGWPAAAQFITAVRRTQFPAFSHITALALLARCRSAAERHSLDSNFFTISTIYPITAQIVRRAHRLLDAHPLPMLLTADDALVAATALIHKLPLYTLDPPRFAAVPGLSAIRPY